MNTSRRHAIALSAILVAGCAATTTTIPPASTTGSAAPAATASSAPAGLPVALTPMEGPTVIDVPADVISTTAITGAGGEVQADGVRIVVPAGAVAGDTTLVVKRLNAPYRMNVFAHSDPTDVPAIPIGHSYDFGPDGVRFARPVDVTLPYEQSSVPVGTDPGRIAVAYFNGNRWAIAGGKADPATQTVTVRLQAFEGEALTAVAVALGIGVVVNRVIKWGYGGEGTNSDPISEKQAPSWITPADPSVEAAADDASVGGVPLGDQEKLAAYLRQNAGAAHPVTLLGPDGKPMTLQGRYSADSGTNWQKPAAYLTRGGMRGDCTDVTNALISMFRNLGYPAKAVFGYAGDKDTPHVWGEVRIGDTPYLIDEDGRLWPLDQGVADLHFIRPDPGDPRAFMWDEAGQTVYDASWWTKAPIVQLGRFDLASMATEATDLDRLNDLIAENQVRLTYEKGTAAAATPAKVRGTFTFILALDDAFMYAIHAGVGQGVFGVDPPPMPDTWRGCTATTTMRGELVGAQTAPGRTTFKGTASIDVTSTVEGCEKTGANIKASPPQSLKRVPWTATGDETGLKGRIVPPSSSSGSLDTVWLFVVHAP